MSVTTNAGKLTKGAPIVITVTISSTVSNEKAEESFVRFIVFGARHSMLMNEGSTAIPACLNGSKQAVPTSLQYLVQNIR